MEDLLFSITEKTEILLIMTMPIHIFLKQLITCQDTQSFKRTAITFTAILLCIYPTHPNYPGCSLKGFSRSVLDVLISRIHPLPFNSRGKRGNKWQREPSAKPSEWEMHCTYRNIKGPLRSSLQFNGFSSLALKLLARALQSLLERTGKSTTLQQSNQLVFLISLIKRGI